MAALPPLATAADLAALTQSDIPAATATVALDAASAVIRGWTRQAITRVVDETVNLRVTDAGELVLPQRPVVSVSRVRAGGTVLSDWTLSGDRLLRSGGWRRLPTAGAYPETGVVEVTYTHGWEDVPAEVRTVCLDLAAATVTNPGMLRTVGIDDYNRTFASESLGAGVLSNAHKEILGAYRRRVGTVTLR
ncbi:hypothetical protein GCM10010406_21110 [Streptomyces thermolineatus]|uniref:Uncharacterized protein n=1 Tax=Streptomyces thermolineatus TaxID=44033 RepID=A0ABN3LKQ9_9ACTN